MRNYLSLLFAFAAILFLAVSFFSLLQPAYVNSATWMIYSYFIALTFAFHFGLVRSSRGKPAEFIRYYMASTTLKLMLHMGVVLLYSLFNRKLAVLFIITFLVFYLLFTAFEVAVVWKKFRRP